MCMNAYLCVMCLVSGVCLCMPRLVGGLMFVIDVCDWCVVVCD